MPKKKKYPISAKDLYKVNREKGKIAPKDLWTHANRFYASYIESLFWSSTQDCGRSFDEDFDYTDLAQDALDEIVSDCDGFLEQVFNREDLADFVESDFDYEQAAHDFCLTRNRHGAGFWDRGLGKVGQILTDISHVYGSQYPYIGDDGKIYLHG